MHFSGLLVVFTNVNVMFTNEISRAPTVNSQDMRMYDTEPIYSPMRATLAYLLVSEGASQHVGEDRERAVSLETFIQAVNEAVEELKGIMLLTKVDTITPQPIHTYRQYHVSNG